MKNKIIILTVFAGLLLSACSDYLAVLCVITGLWHQQTVGWGESKILLIISFVFAFTHLAFYLYRLGKQFTSLTR